MARERFQDIKMTGDINIACKYDDGTVRYWQTRKESVIQNIRTIINQYSSKGYVLTLRQLHYQLVTRNWIINHDTAYKKLGDILTECRYAGVIDWDAIEDRGRVPYIPYWAEDARDAISDTCDYFRVDLQRGQKSVVELWTEKDALSGILKRTTEKYHIRLVVNKGYTSSSAIYDAYKRVCKAILSGRTFTVLYFGDHDPSGLDMIRDIRERLMLMLSRGHRFANGDGVFDKILHWWNEKQYNLYDLIDEGFCGEEVKGLLGEGAEGSKKYDQWAEDFDAGRIVMYLVKNDLFRVIPIGLTMEQIQQYNLPPNPTKLTDSRAVKYIKKYGKTCWEVDALSPEVLTDLVETFVTGQIDMGQFEAMQQFQDAELAKLKELASKND